MTHFLNRLPKLLLCLCAFLLLFFPLSPTQIYAQGEEWSGLGSKVLYTCTYDGAATIQGIECLVGNVLRVAISLIGIFVLVMLVFGAYQFLTSGGDPKGVAAGKATITYAIIGLILAISAWFILNLIATATGTNDGDTNILRFNTQVSN